MAGSYSTVDLSQLKAPGVVETLDYEQIVSSMLADLQARDSSFTALLESDPALKVIEVCAYRELLLRQRINEAAYAVMLSSATEADLDQIGANYGVARKIILPANPDAVPPTEAVYETDEAFRSRIQLSLEGYSVAGPRGAYVFHALSADGRVLDANAVSPTPGVVHVYVLSALGSGVPDIELLNAVNAYLNDERIRPLTDQVVVLPASIVEYSVEAELTLYPGPDAQVVLRAARDAVDEYAASVAKLGQDVAVSGLIRALHQPGVQSVRLTSPLADIAIADGQASRCTGVTLSVEGTND